MTPLFRTLIRLVQDGTHADLLSSPGPYARLFRAQAAWYQREDVVEE